MNGRILLDTNIVIRLFANDQIVQQRLEQTEQVFIPSVVLGELYYGAHKSMKIEENILRIKEFAQQNSILACDTLTAQHYGRIKNALRLKGKPIPENDLWIAALGVQYSLVVVTRDEHFNAIDALTVEQW